MSRGANASTVYASIWAHSRDGMIYLAGHGRAGGYGYDKVSSAIDAALSDAGVTMERHFGGCGEGPTIIALTALAKRLGWKTGEILVS